MGRYISFLPPGVRANLLQYAIQHNLQYLHDQDSVRISNRISPASVTVQAGIVTLFNEEPTVVNVVSIQPYSSFDYVTGLHDIALIQVTSTSV